MLVYSEYFYLLSLSFPEDFQLLDQMLQFVYLFRCYVACLIYSQFCYFGVVLSLYVVTLVSCAPYRV